MPLNWLATLLGNRGRAEEALLLQRQALLLDPTHVGLAGNLAVNLIKMGRIEEADAYVRGGYAGLTEVRDAIPESRRERCLEAALGRMIRLAEAQGNVDEAEELEALRPKGS